MENIKDKIKNIDPKQLGLGIAIAAGAVAAVVGIVKLMKHGKRKTDPSGFTDRPMDSTKRW